MIHAQYTGNRFHGRYDAVTASEIKRYFERLEESVALIQERDVNYRLYLHQHPYVQELIRRLLREGEAGLQNADTSYAGNLASLPDSVELALPANAMIRVPGGAGIALLANMTATSEGVPIELPANRDYKLAGSQAVSVVLTEGAKATLTEGLEPTPAVGETWTLAEHRPAVIHAEMKVKFAAAATVLLYNGKKADIPAGAEVLLAAYTPITIVGGVSVTLLKSKRRPELFADFFAAGYDPNPLMVKRPYPVKDLDFSSSGAYSVYNWELFFHVPLAIAVHLSKNQRYAEAQRWFHYVFDPTDAGGGPTPQRFWKARPLQDAEAKRIEEILVNLATGADPALRDDTVNSIKNWQENPFRPHVIARYRHQAYMYKVVMAYLDNLIAWGDSLFRQDSGEAIDEALMLYLLAAGILGPRPQAVPKKGAVRPKTYADLSRDLRDFGTVLRDVEADIPFDLMPFPHDAGGDGRLATLRSLGTTLYFSVPRNDKLLGYWDTVADRLFKIRNSLNFQGVYRQLALYDPPIDPGMLAKAAAANLDVGAIVNGVNQPLPLVRFALLAQKAAEIAHEVKSLGNSLLSAMEKEDGEAMAILRAKHERAVMEMTEHVKYGQWQEAVKSREALRHTLALAVHRYAFYELQLGKSREEIEKAVAEALEALGELDREGLASLRFAMEEPEMGLRELRVDIAGDAFAQAAQALNGGKLLSSYEVREALLLEAAQLASDIGAGLNVASAAAAYVPQFEVSAEPWGIGGATTFGGSNIASAITAYANAARGTADRLNFEARRANRMDALQRRELDWTFQSNLAAGEINQIFRQLRASQLREAIAEQELQNHRRQMKLAEEVERFLNEEGMDKNGKSANKALYAWMKREVKALYAQCFQFAYDVAKKAERALQHELGTPDASFIQYGYLSGKEGLLAGEKLFLDVKRMELAYHERNYREYEMTKHVSLMQLDPLALITLRTTGRCTVRLPESLFDMDGPGHYYRRIKTVALSIPCVAGPYASVNCTLTLLKSSIRKSQVLTNGKYERINTEDSRFSDYYGSLQSIVTSSSQNDSGLFEPHSRDERYLPFENAGAVSEWQLTLPADPSQKEPCQFDYNTISDVVLHLKYTAREGGELLRQGAIDHLKALIANAQMAGSVRLFSARREFPTAWAKFKAQAPERTRHELAVNLGTEHYPYWSTGRLNAVKRIDVWARGGMANLEIYGGADNEEAASIGSLAASDGLLKGKLTEAALPSSPLGQLRWYFDSNAVDDLWIAVTWSE